MGVAMNNMPLLSHMIAVTNRQLCTRSFTEQIERICHAKPDRIILREKDLEDKAYEALLCSVLPICDEYEIPLFVSGRIELAAKYNTGLHLSYNDFMAFNQTKTVGVSVHSAAEAENAARNNATYIIAGHILPLTAKKAYRRGDLIFWKIYAAVLRQLAPS